MKFLGALIGAASLIGLSAGAYAADLPTAKPAPVFVAPAPAQLGFFVKLGLLYAVNSSKSKLYSQSPLLPPTSPQFLIPGVGANVANVFTLGFEAGYFVTQNISIDIAGGVPMYAAVRTKGAFRVAPLPVPVPDGTRLATVMPSFVPFTALYHFTQFGQFQPYLGAGIAPVFSFTQKSGFNTGVTVDPTIGLVLQSGVDVMFDRHWGLSLDVKKLFARTTTHATGDNLAVIGLAGNPQLAGTLKTNFQPWVVSTGVTYRF